jgi:hypothetical protein
MTLKEWLAGLKTGDRVVLAGCGYRGEEIRLCRVDHATKTLVQLNGGGRYRRKDGCPVGAGADIWASARLFIRPLGEGDIERVRRQRNLRKLKDTQWQDLADDTLAAVCAIVDMDKAKKEETSTP